MKAKKKWWITGIAIAIFMACVLSLFASPEPDGLERVAEDQGFLGKAEGQEVIHAPMPDYVMPGIENEQLAAVLAGLVGVLIILGVTLGWTKILKNKRKS